MTADAVLLLVHVMVSPLPQLGRLAPKWRRSGLGYGLVLLAGPTVLQAASMEAVWVVTSEVCLAAVLLMALAGAWIWVARRRAGRQVAQKEMQLSSLLEFADCLLWQSTVTLETWEWDITVQPTGLAQRIFGAEQLPKVTGLWGIFELPERVEMDRRAREAMERGLPGYEQEFFFTKGGTTFWLRESVTITQLGGGRFSLVGLVTEITRQRELERARRESEERLRQLLSRADCMLWQARAVRNAQGAFEWEWFIPDSELYRRVGGAAGPNAPMPWNATVVPEFPAMCARADAALQQGLGGYEQEFRVLLVSGVRWMHEAVTLVALGPGEWRLEGVVTDITAQRRAEEAKRASEQQLEGVLQKADFMLWHARVFRGPGDWFHWVLNVPDSTLYRRVFGRAPEEPEQMHWREVVGGEDYEVMVERANGALARGEAGYQQEIRGRRGDDVFWLHEEATITPVREGEWQIVGIVTDVTTRHLAEAALQRSERVLREILERASCLIWRASVRRRVTGEMDWMNFELPASRLSNELRGGKPTGTADRLWEFAQVPELAEMNRRSSEAILAGASGYEQEYRVAVEGRSFWLHEQVTIARDGAEAWRLVGVVTDVTQRHEALDAQRRSEGRLEELMERADCLVWEAEVSERPGGELDWNLFAPRSALHRRLFGEAAPDENGLKWERLDVPELAEIAQRAREAVLRRAPGYEQVFRVIQLQRVIWLREAVSITVLAPDRFRLVGVITDITAQREAQEAHRASLAQVEQMLGGADCMVWQARVFAVEGGRMHWLMFIPRSRLYRELFGRDPDSPANLRWSEVLDAATEREIDERAIQAMRSGADSYEHEFRAQRGERVFWLHERTTITVVGPGEWQLVGVMTDLTARRAAEQSVRASELRYRTLYQHTPVAIVEADFSEVARWLAGLRAEGLSDLEAWLAADASRLLQVARRVKVLDCNDTAMVLLRARSKSDFRRRRGVLASMDSMRLVKEVALALWDNRNGLEAEIDMFDFEGGLHRVNLRWWMEREGSALDHRQSVLVIVDLTELKQAQAALAAEKERLAVTLRAMAEGVITTDVAGRVQFMNEAAAQFTGCPAAGAIGRPVGEVCVFENDRTGERIVVPVARVAQGDVVVELPPRTRMRGTDGVPRLVDGCCAPIHSAQSKVIGTVLVFRDVTEHERLEQQLVRATKLESVGILAGGIAHDFNNILTAVMGNVALAALDLAPDSEAATCLAEAERATVRARDLTQQLLTFAKGGEPVRAAVLLGAVVREITNFTLHGSKVKAQFEEPADLWAADADKAQIGRVVQNLVLNAVQAMADGGTLRVTLANELADGLTSGALVPGRYVRIEIADTGAGIHPEHLSRIFDPYFTTKQTGSGLGLAAVYSIVNKHRGTIDVQSQLGVGTTFRLWLPAAAEPAAVEGAVDRPVPAVNFQGRVLFMDDEEAIRQMATFLLRRFGFEVVCAADGAEAVRLFAEAQRGGVPFALVIMDLTVPGGMGGREAIARLREIDPKVRAIVSSGYSSDPVLANFREHGFCGVATKPYEVSELARVLREALAV